MTTCPICEIEFCKEDFLSDYLHNEFCDYFVRVTTRPGYIYIKRKEQDKMHVLAQRLFRHDRRDFAIYHAFHLIVKADFSYSYKKADFPTIILTSKHMQPCASIKQACNFVLESILRS